MRLLAITPPASGMPSVDPGVVDAWVDAGALELGLVVLLREPRAAVAQTLAADRFMGLREALAARGIVTLVSVDADIDERDRLAAIERIQAARPAVAGVQLRGDPSPEVCARWRLGLGAEALIGRSCHGLPPDRGPAPGDVDYTCVAPVFSPRTAQPGVVKHPIGLEALRRWARVVPKVFALGGVDPDRAGACLAAGATGIAGISLFFAQSGVAHDHVQALRQVFARASEGLDLAPTPAPDDDDPQPRPRPR